MRVPTCVWLPAVFLSLLAFADISSPSSAQPTSPIASAAATDLYGDPLPPGAVVRLGTVRFRRSNEEAVYGLTYLAGDQEILTAQGNELQLWNVADGRLLRTLPSPVALRGFAIAPDRRRIAVAGTASNENFQGAAIHILDTTSGQSLRLLKRSDFREVLDVKLGFSPDATVLFSAGRNLDVRGEEVGSGKEILRKKLAKDNVQDLAVSSDGQHLALACAQRIYLWKWREQEPSVLLEKTGATAVRFSPDGKFLAALSPGKLRLWRIEDRKATGNHNLPAIQDAVYGALEFTPDGRTILVGSRAYNSAGSGQVLMLDAATGKDKGALRTESVGMFIRITSWIAPSSDSKRLACPQGQGICIFDLESQKDLTPFKDAHTTAPMGIHFASQGQVVTRSDDKTARIWEAKTGKHLREYRAGTWVRGIAVSPDGRLLVASAFDDTVRVMDFESGKEIYRLPGHGAVGGHRMLAFAPDGGSFVSWGDDFHLRRWDVRTGRALIEHALRPSGVDFEKKEDLPGPGRAEAGPSAVTPDGKTLLLDCAGHYYWFDIATGRETKRVGHGRTFGGGMALSPNGKHLLASEWGEGKDHALTLRDLDGDTFTAISIPGRVAGPVAFSPDGRGFASAVYDAREIRVFETSSLKLRYRIRNVPGRVWSLAFAPDGRRLASGLTDSTVLIWDLTRPARE